MMTFEPLELVHNGEVLTALKFEFYLRHLARSLFHFSAAVLIKNGGDLMTTGPWDYTGGMRQLACGD